jgi:hypothetical protein
LNSPIRLLEKVTWRFVGFSIFFSSTFPRPIGPDWCSFSCIQPARTCIANHNSHASDTKVHPWYEPNKGFICVRGDSKWLQTTKIMR